MLSHAWCMGMAAGALLAISGPGARPAFAEGPRSRQVSESGPMKVGRPSPSFGGWTTEGKAVSLKQLLPEGKGALVVSFFATWCKPCKDNLPAIQRVVVSSPDRSARGVLVAFGERAEVARPFLEDMRISLPTVLDPFEKIAARLGVDRALPRTFVLSADGTVQAIFVLEGADFESQLRGAVAKAAAFQAEPAGAFSGAR